MTTLRPKPRQANYLGVAGLASLLAASVTAIGLNYFPGYQNLLLIATAGACVLPALRAWIRGTFDPFDPVYSIALSTLIHFCLQVFIFVNEGTFQLLGVDYTAEIPKLVSFALFALLSFYLGYYWWPRQKGASIEDKPSLAASDMAYAHRVAIIIFLGVCTMLVLWIVIARVPLWTLWVFGEANYQEWLTASSGPTIGYFQAARSSLPACLILLAGTRKSRIWSPSMIVIIAAITLFLAGLGGRQLVLTAIGSVVSLYYIQSNKRPSTLQLILMGIVALVLIVGVIGYYRTGGRAVGQDSLDAVILEDSVVRASALPISTAVYVQWYPARISYEWGATFLAILVQPIPSFLFPQKHLLFDSGAAIIAQALTVGSAKPVWAEFYVNFGLTGIFIGMALLGIICRKIYGTYTINRQNLFSQLYVSLLWIFLFHFYSRGDAAFLFIGTVYTFGPIWLAQWLVGWHQRRSKRLALQKGLALKMPGLAQRF